MFRASLELAKDQEEIMFDHRFLASKVGAAALVSIAAMIAFNFYALALQADVTPDLMVVVVPMVELA